MSAKKPDISKIDKYLKGELDSRAMHQLEREAQDDPFLMDALEGYQSTGKNQQANVDELKNRLALRIAARQKNPVVLWRKLAIAASVLLLLGIAYWIFKPKTVVKQYANLVELKKPVETPTATKQAPPAQVITRSVQKQAKPAAVKENQSAPPAPQNSLIASAKVTNGKDEPVYKMDTVEYRASDYKANRNATADELLKKMSGIQVGADGNAVSQGRQITKARINGKDFVGGNIQSAAKNLPADMLEKVQIIDAVGNQATKAKKGNPDTPRLIATNQVAKPIQLREVAIPHKETDTTPSLSEVVVIKTARPVIDWNEYNMYINKHAVMPNGTTGMVIVVFNLAPDGTITNIHVTGNSNKAMNEKAIAIIKNGPKWIGGAKTQEIKLKINFHK
ncbi:MAG TPA: energy transducer TonB [Mucilaginibacter sp.]|nr:energy transducer TonB [Mucilaginibacter sp.]